tara:strand:+ start:923 stop:1234 length:312 start_codon:yes stop_codon:yes gene_type:complete
MCGGGGGGGSGSGESLNLQRQSLALSREQFEESKRQWGEQFKWQRDKAEEQKRVARDTARARAGREPVRTTEYAMSALEGKQSLGFGKDKLRTGVTGKGLAIV